MPESLQDLRPTDPLMYLAWVDGIISAVSNQALLKQFYEETGCRYRPPASPIERMIDEATGADEAFAVAFIRWWNQRIWGEVNGRACNGDELGLDADLESAVD